MKLKMIQCRKRKKCNRSKAIWGWKIVLLFMTKPNSSITRSKQENFNPQDNKKGCEVVESRIKYEYLSMVLGGGYDPPIGFPVSSVYSSSWATGLPEKPKNTNVT